VPPNEFSRRVVVDPWPGGGIAVDVTADAAERRALARRFGLIEVAALRGHGRLERAHGEIVFHGWLEAAVVQPCVVTLEAVPATLRQPIERRYRLGAAGVDLEPHGVVDLDDEEEVEAVSGREIDLGEAVAEELGLSLEPYPRAAAAAEVAAAADLGPYVSLGSPVPPEKPLAALGRLQEKRAR
jgi:hypothetical protein